MAQTEAINLTNGMPSTFHAVGRARLRSRATAIVGYQGKPAFVSIDFALGEPGKERQIFQVDRTGVFPLPGTIEPNELVSIRPRHCPTGEVTLEIRFEPIP